MQGHDQAELQDVEKQAQGAKIALVLGAGEDQPGEIAHSINSTNTNLPFLNRQ
ncbi:hypothetical protein [Erythrobacter sp.]|uniref:hypothetical protein n=1 Tax=Erythrobacter sp. TaxID=1042 RepID=UPI0025F6B4EB|nr:hypothetical protein [Erythrobacter sp.]